MVWGGGVEYRSVVVLVKCGGGGGEVWGGGVEYRIVVVWWWW